MIAGFAHGGLLDRAIEVCKEMVTVGRPKPDAGTMATILPATENTASENITFIKKVFDDMPKKGLISWNAMICVEEAYGFIIRMPVEPYERVWGALLGACQVHSDMEIGLIAADNLFKLVPTQSGYYVLLSNIYAKAGRWGEVMSVRRVMLSKGIKKVPGDTSHPQSEKIYEKLEALFGRMKDLGSVAATDDVEEEDKEGHLSVHSEKLAIAFVLINTRPGTPIRIAMNLRMCGDCHHAAKLISIDHH
ncbi:putative pentatricopeptide repeat-containing protein At3g49142 [Typha latifolia]|uniref:putative pentatricopeptide repeat-containing protein At3g49142 n=1 Tax=Typha latifolia TaxID=4733 RepID=UPI003C2FB8EA